MNRTVLRNVVICAFAIGLCTGFVFQTDKAYARVSLTDLQNQINDLQDDIDTINSEIGLLQAEDVNLQGQIDDLDGQVDVLESESQTHLRAFDIYIVKVPGVSIGANSYISEYVECNDSTHRAIAAGYQVNEFYRAVYPIEMYAGLDQWTTSACYIRIRNDNSSARSADLQCTCVAPR